MRSGWKSRGARGGGGSLGFGQILLGVYLELSENQGGVPFFRFFIAFLCDNFSDLTPPRPPCAKIRFESVVHLTFFQFFCHLNFLSAVASFIQK
jgi:hypothetical protein